MKKYLIPIIAVLFFLIPHQAHAAIGFVNRTEVFSSSISGSGTATLASPSINVIGGNFLYVFVDAQNNCPAIDNGGGFAGNTTTLTDTAGNTFIPMGIPPITSNSNCVYQFYAKNVNGSGSDVVTEHIDSSHGGSTGTYQTFTVYQYNGVDKTNPLDNSNQSSSFLSGSTMSTGNITVSGTSDLLIGGMEADGQPITGGSGFTFTAITDGFGGYTGDEYKFTSTSQAVTASQSSSLGWIMVGASFKAAKYVRFSVGQNLTQVLGNITTGLVGWWKFDQGSGTVAVDSSGNSNTGTLTTTGVDGPPIWVTGKIGPSAIRTNLNGDQYTSIPNSSSLQVGDAFTISAWINPTDLTQRWDVFSTRYPSNNSGAWQLEVGSGFGTNSNTNTVAVTGSGTYINCGANSLLATGNWYMITYVHPTGTGVGTIYINGQPISSDVSCNTTYAISNNTDPKVISAGTSDFYPGNTDDVRLYNTTLTASQVSQLYQYTGYTYNRVSIGQNIVQIADNVLSSIVSWYKFDEGKGIIAYNSSPTLNNAVLNNAPTYVQGKVGPYSLSFNGTNQNVNVPFNAAFDVPHATFSAWIKTSTDGGCIMSRGPFIVFDYCIDHGISGGSFPGLPSFFNDSLGSWVNANTVVTDGNWHFVAVTIDGTNAKFYLDGKPDGSAANPDLPTGAGTALCIGSRLSSDCVPADDSLFFTGNIDDARIYSSALTASQIAALYLYTGYTYNRFSVY